MVDSFKYPLPVQVLALTKFAGIGPRLFDLLLQRFADPNALFTASEEALLAVSGVTKAAAQKVKRAKNYLEQAQEYLRSLHERKIAVSTRFDEAYGHRLFELNDPPPLLYWMGEFPDPDSRAVTLVGTDEGATAEGIAWTTTLARAFAAEGIQAVSSLRGGNDAAVHLGSRAGGGKSFAVVDGGFDSLDPVEQMPLAVDIAHQGGLVSEFPMEAPAAVENMPACNRLMAGFGQAVVISEIYHSSARLHDLLEFCGLIGKMAIVTVDPVNGPLADKESLDAAVKHGAVILQGPNQIRDIIRSLV